MISIGCAFDSVDLNDITKYTRIRIRNLDRCFWFQCRRNCKMWRWPSPISPRCSRRFSPAPTVCPVRPTFPRSWTKSSRTTTCRTRPLLVISDGAISMWAKITTWKLNPFGRGFDHRSAEQKPETKRPIERRTVVEVFVFSLFLDCFTSDVRYGIDDRVHSLCEHQFVDQSDVSHQFWSWFSRSGCVRWNKWPACKPTAWSLEFRRKKTGKTSGSNCQCYCLILSALCRLLSCFGGFASFPGPFRRVYEGKSERTSQPSALQLFPADCTQRVRDQSIADRYSTSFFVTGNTKDPCCLFLRCTQSFVRNTWMIEIC